MSGGKPRAKGWAGDRERRYYFFLNPYEDCAFTRCPKCEQKTRLRKFCLFIHIDPHHLVSFNKTCKFCTHCELIIVKKTELESYLAAICEPRWPEVIGNDYLVMGTLDRKLHREGTAIPMPAKAAIDRFTPFVDHLDFEVRGGWHLPGR